MSRSLKWRSIVVAAAIILSLVYIYPSLVEGDLPTWWQKALPSEKINLGLDLKGGMHLVLEVQVETAVQSALDRIVEDLKAELRKDKIPVMSVARTADNKIEIKAANENNQERLNKLLENKFPHLVTDSSGQGDDAYSVVLAMDKKEAKRIRDLAVSQGLETIRNRIDQMGMKEPDIRLQGEDRIIVQIPGIEDPDKAIELMKTTAFLEFKLVDESRSPEKALAEGPPPGTEVLYELKTNPETGRTTKIPFLLRKRTQMTGAYVTDARVQIDNQFNTPYVSLNFDSNGSRIFEQITGANINKRLAIVLDGVVKSAPVIQDKIGGGRAQITGNFTMEEARNLAIVLRSGALLAPVKVLEERTVGASLGEDSINMGVNSIVVGLILVMIFMVIYYRMSGVIADVALLLNLLLIMAVLASFRATLTLPGIAGILLTIGMSVDANVLIFERIREEIRLGKTPRAAVDGGFGKALWTIVDANVTTLIVAIVLFQFGTGPIRGFAVTLSIGIVASFFTAIFVSRLIFDYLLVQLKMKAVSV